MTDALYLAWRYLSYNRVKTAVLVSAVAIIVYLPLGLNTLINESGKQLRRRAETTPLLVGAKGSPLELVLRSLYFETDEPRSIPYKEVERIVDSGLADAIPIHVRFRTRHGPIVGTTLDYFEVRGLRVAAGRPMAMLGECVIGSDLARSADLQVGDTVLSANEDLFDLAGVYPLKMRVVGVLERSDSPDDGVAFVDLKTTWVIQGLGHGHQDVGQSGSADVLSKEGNRVVANASVVNYNEITSENAASFHFHGELANFPMTAVIAVPHDRKSSAMLRGRYLGDDEDVQIIQPKAVMDELLGTVFTVGRYVTFAVLIVGLATVATMSLVFLLSIELRRRELETMIKIGATRLRVGSVLATEALAVLVWGGLMALALTAVTYWFARSATEFAVQMY